MRFDYHPWLFDAVYLLQPKELIPATAPSLTPPVQPFLKNHHRTIEIASQAFVVASKKTEPLPIVIIETVKSDDSGLIRGHLQTELGQSLW